MDKIADKYDGMSTFIISYTIQLTEFALSGKDFNNISRFNLLVENPNEWMLTNISDELLIETSLLNYCILVEYILKNKTFVYIF